VSKAGTDGCDDEVALTVPLRCGVVVAGVPLADATVIPSDVAAVRESVAAGGMEDCFDPSSSLTTAADVVLGDSMDVAMLAVFSPGTVAAPFCFCSTTTISLAGVSRASLLSAGVSRPNRRVIFVVDSVGVLPTFSFSFGGAGSGTDFLAIACLLLKNFCGNLSASERV
jgi:hypothetical protein